MKTNPGVTRFIKYVKTPALIAGFILVFIIAYFPFSVNIHKQTALNFPGHSFMMFWRWREWVAGFIIDSFLQARPFSLWNLLYYGILSAGTLPESGPVMDVLLVSYPLNNILSIPYPLYYNLKFIIILLFNSLAGYYAVRRITENEKAGIICGIFMAVNPFLIMTLAKARLRAGILGFVILCLLYLYELPKKPRWKTAALLGVFLALTSLFYAFYGLFMIGIIALVFLGRIILDLKRKQGQNIQPFLKNLLLTGLVSIILVVPWLLPYVFRKEEPIDSPGHTSVMGIALFQDLPTPEEVYSPGFGKGPGGRDREVIRLIMTEQLPLYFYFPLFFALLAVAAFFKPRPLVYLLIIIFAAFYILSLGPYLRIANDTELSGIYRAPWGGYIPLPYILFYKFVPFISRFHHPDHMLSFASVALMFLSGIGLANLDEIFRKKNLKYASTAMAVILAVLLTIGVRWYHPRVNYQACDIHIPGIYTDLAREKAGAVIEAPIPSPGSVLNDVFDRNDLYQTYHGKKYLLSNFEGLGEMIPGTRRMKYMFHRDYRDLTSLQNQLLLYLETAPRGADPDYEVADVEEIKKLGYRWLVLHEADFVAFGERSCPPLTGADRFQAYWKAKKHLDNSKFFEPVKTSTEYRLTFIPTHYDREKMVEYEVTFYRMR